jgi:hypothetical protein
MIYHSAVRQLYGETGAQSSVLHAFDAALGVQHEQVRQILAVRKHDCGGACHVTSRPVHTNGKMRNPAPVRPAAGFYRSSLPYNTVPRVPSPTRRAPPTPRLAREGEAQRASPENARSRGKGFAVPVSTVIVAKAGRLNWEPVLNPLEPPERDAVRTRRHGFTVPSERSRAYDRRCTQGKQNI